MHVTEMEDVTDSSSSSYILCICIHTRTYVRTYSAKPEDSVHVKARAEMLRREREAGAR